MDYVRENTNSDLPIGRFTILPYSFQVFSTTGNFLSLLIISIQRSTRNMQKNCQDTMSVVTHKGKPDLFVTITMNPKCREVIENLLPGQTRNDRPDLVARVFKQKLDELINDIKKIISL